MDPDLKHWFYGEYEMRSKEISALLAQRERHSFTKRKPIGKGGEEHSKMYRLKQCCGSGSERI